MLASAQLYEFRKPSPGLVVSGAPSGGPADPAPATGAPAAQLSTSSLAFGAVAVGSSAQQSVQLSNTGNAALNLGGVSTSGAGFSVTTSCGATLAPGASCVAQVTFAPASAGAVSGALSFSSNAAGSPHMVALSGVGAQAQGSLTAQTSADFGSVAVGSSASRSFTFTNTGTVPATGVQALVSGAGLSLTANTCGASAGPVSLAAGASCSMTVQWVPAAEGALSSASLTVSGSFANSPSSLSLSGTGVLQTEGDLYADVSTHFGTLDVGTSATRTFTFENIGAGPASGTYASLSGAGLTFVANTCGTQASPVTVAPEASCQMTVQWAPSVEGELQGTLSVTSGAVNSPSTLNLSGISAAGAVTLGPANASYGVSPTNLAATRYFQLTNAGAAKPYTGLAVSGTNFSIVSGGTCAAPSGTLPANGSCTVAVRFLSSSAGSFNATLSVTSNGQTLQSSLSATAQGATAAISGSSSSLTAPPLYVLGTNTVNSDSSSASATSSALFVYGAGLPVRTYTITLDGAPGITLASVGNCAPGGSCNTNSVSGYSATRTTTSSSPILRVAFAGTTSTPGTQVLASNLRITSTDGFDQTVPVTVELRYDVTTSALKSGASSNMSSSANVAAGATTSLGVATYNRLNPATSGLLSRWFYVETSGTRGVMAGHWVLSGSGGFTFGADSRRASPSASGGSTSCGTRLSGNRETQVCVAQDIGLATSYPEHSHGVQVVFRPSSEGVKTAVLTFVPSAGTGAAPVQFKLSAEGRYDVTISALKTSSGTSWSLSTASTYTPGNTFNMSAHYNPANPASSTVTVVRFYAQVGGTRGAVAGRWVLSGSEDFTFTADARKGSPSGSGGSSACSTRQTGNRQTNVCVADDIGSGTSYPEHSHGVTVQFVPSSLGAKTATLAFIPEPSTGLAAVEFNLSGQGRFDIDITGWRVNAGAGVWGYSSGTTVSLNGSLNTGSVAVGSSVTARSAYLVLGGSWGFLTGKWTLSGSPAFSLNTDARKGNTGTTSSTCSARLAGNLETEFCTSDERSASQFTQGIGLRFAPTTAGAHSAVLTFTPHPSTGLAPVSLTLTGTGT